MEPFAELLAGGPAALDGGLASELEARGHDLSGDLWSARVLAADPDAIRQVHETYFRHGARVGISASYQASRTGFERHGLSAARADELLALSVELVRQARDAAGTDGFVAASVGPYGATLHDGSEYRGHYGVPVPELTDFHSERLAVLVDAGPDLLAVETIPDLVEAEAVGAALAALNHPVPAWLSFSCADAATTNAGQPIEVAARFVAGHPAFSAIGVNCTAPEHVGGLIGRIRSVAPELPVVVYPNAGRVWDGDASRWLGAGADVIADSTVAEWFAAGAALVGGCCGLGPAAVSRMAAVAAAERAPVEAAGALRNGSQATERVRSDGNDGRS